MVITGGSAGAICWFQGGHSDSHDPDSYKEAMRKRLAETGDEASSAPETDKEKKEWDYIRVDGLSFLPGLVCPHYDQVQSNGILRSEDFNAMMLRHPTEIGIGIDHWAALQVNGDLYEVVSISGKRRFQSHSDDKDHESEEDSDEDKPGVWLCRVTAEGQVETVRCPSKGSLQDLVPAFPSRITSDPRVEACRKENPDDGPI